MTEALDYRLICVPVDDGSCPFERAVEAERGGTPGKTVLERATGFSSLITFDDGTVITMFIWDVACGPVARGEECCYVGLIESECVQNCD